MPSQRKIFYHIEDGKLASRRAVSIREGEYESKEDALAALHEDREDMVERRLNDDEQDIVIDTASGRHYAVQIKGLNMMTITSHAQAPDPEAAMIQVVRRCQDRKQALHQYQVVEVTDIYGTTRFGIDGNGAEVFLSPTRSINDQFREFKGIIQRPLTYEEDAFWKRASSFRLAYHQGQRKTEAQKREARRLKNLDRRTSSKG